MKLRHIWGEYSRAAPPISKPLLWLEDGYSMRCPTLGSSAKFGRCLEWWTD